MLSTKLYIIIVVKNVKFKFCNFIKYINKCIISDLLNLTPGRGVKFNWIIYKGVKFNWVINKGARLNWSSLRVSDLIDPLFHKKILNGFFLILKSPYLWNETFSDPYFWDIYILLLCFLSVPKFWPTISRPPCRPHIWYGWESISWNV